MKQKVLFSDLYRLNFARIKGDLYSNHDDFIVQESLKYRVYPSISFEQLQKPLGKRKPYVVCVLVKKGISTFNAIRTIAIHMGISEEEIRYHGLKDTFGLTAQRISFPSPIFLTKFKDLKRKEFKDFFLKEAVYSKYPCEIRKIWGNHFKVTIKEVDSKKVIKTLDTLKGLIKKGIPSFYGHQRFGARQDNHLIGKQLILGNYDLALRLFCLNSCNESKKRAKIRGELSRLWTDWDRCLDVLNKSDSMKDEKEIISHLVSHPSDYLGAINKTPLTNFFIGSYSSYLFNLVLLEILKDKKRVKNLPLPGYKTLLRDKYIRNKYLKILKAEGIKIKQFFNKEHKELCYPGRIRQAFYNISDLKYKLKKKNLILEFSLPMGVYANLFLNNVIKNKLKDEKLE
jgi:tRNA pseudouridine13 synthase